MGGKVPAGDVQTAISARSNATRLTADSNHAPQLRPESFASDSDEIGHQPSHTQNAVAGYRVRGESELPPMGLPYSLIVSPAPLVVTVVQVTS